MADSGGSRLDVWLERLSKLAGILLPIVIAIIGGVYTLQRDRSDNALRLDEQKRAQAQKAFDNTQKQYANLTALLPLLTSGKDTQVQIGLEIYLSEAKAFQAPTDLLPTIRRLSNLFPEQARLIQLATDAGRRQQGQQCTANTDGIYVQVANDSQQLSLGKALANQLTDMDISPPVQGVQRIDRGPRSTELRYYSSKDNDVQAAGIILKLAKAGIENVKNVDLTKQYLKPGCQPPAVYELWIGASSPLARLNRPPGPPDTP